MAERRRESNQKNADKIKTMMRTGSWLANSRSNQDRCIYYAFQSFDHIMIIFKYSQDYGNKFILIGPILDLFLIFKPFYFSGCEK